MQQEPHGIFDHEEPGTWIEPEMYKPLFFFQAYQVFLTSSCLTLSNLSKMAYILLLILQSHSVSKK